jgi:hypothetical protein
MVREARQKTAAWAGAAAGVAPGRRPSDLPAGKTSGFERQHRDRARCARISVTFRWRCRTGVADRSRTRGCAPAQAMRRRWFRTRCRCATRCRARGRSGRRGSRTSPGSGLDEPVRADVRNAPVDQRIRLQWVGAPMSRTVSRSSAAVVARTEAARRSVRMRIHAQVSSTGRNADVMRSRNCSIDGLKLGIKPTGRCCLGPYRQ